jgi:hypothetical protein
MEREITQGLGEVTVPDKNGIPTPRKVSLTIRVETSGGQIVSSGRLKPPKYTEEASDNIQASPEPSFSKAHLPLGPGRSARHLA